MILFVLAVSFLLKTGVRLFLSRGLNYWETGYNLFYEIAGHWLREGRFYTLRGFSLEGVHPAYAFRPPLYPLCIATFLKFAHGSAPAFILAEAFVSTLTVFVVYQIAKQLHGPRAALGGAFLYAFFPYAFFHDTQLQETVLYNALSLISVWSLLSAVNQERKSLFFLTGIFLGLATLTRASHLLHSLFLTAILLWAFRVQFKRATAYLVLALFGFAVVVAPWALRNKKLSGAFTVATKQGYDLAFAHNEFTFLYYPYRGSIDQSTRHFFAHLTPDQRTELREPSGDEVRGGRRYQAFALDYIKKHPLQTLKRGFYKVAVNFLGILSPLHGPLANTAHFVSYWLLTLLALVSLPKVWKTFYFQAFVALSLSQAAVSFVFWAHTSHRSFLDPMLAVLAGIGLASLLEKKPEPATI